VQLSPQIFWNYPDHLKPVMTTNTMYAMQRANGDWFALDQREGFRVPIFSSNRQAMQARAFNVEMLVFKPVPLGEHALIDLAPAAGQRATHFWLVNDACVNMKQGVSLKHSELAQMILGETLDNIGAHDSL
jgi:hypothetical protein